MISGATCSNRGGAYQQNNGDVGHFVVIVVLHGTENARIQYHFRGRSTPTVGFNILLQQNLNVRTNATCIFTLKGRSTLFENGVPCPHSTLSTLELIAVPLWWYLGDNPKIPQLRTQVLVLSSSTTRVRSTYKFFFCFYKYGSLSFVSLSCFETIFLAVISQMNRIEIGYMTMVMLSALKIIVSLLVCHCIPQDYTDIIFQVAHHGQPKKNGKSYLRIWALPIVVQVIVY
jgi:hypothetical protein